MERTASARDAGSAANTAQRSRSDGYWVFLRCQRLLAGAALHEKLYSDVSHLRRG